jgi:hypothetical protein
VEEKTLIFGGKNPKIKKIIEFVTQNFQILQQCEIWHQKKRLLSWKLDIGRG